MDKKSDEKDAERNSHEMLHENHKSKIENKWIGFWVLGF